MQVARAPVSPPDRAIDVKSFEDLGVSPELTEALAAEGIETPTPIQEAAFPVVAKGNNIVLSAGPGSGVFAAWAAGAMERIEPPFLDLHAAEWTGDSTYEIRGDARRFENWETYYAGKLGLGAAVDYALDLGVDVTWERVQALGARLRESLSALAGVSVHDKGATRGGIVTFVVDGVDAGEVHELLSRQRMNVSTSPAGHARLDIAHRGLPTLVRASVHYYNSEEEIGRFAEAVAAIAEVS